MLQTQIRLMEKVWHPLLAGALALLIQVPVQAAEQIRFQYGLLGRTVQLADLEAFVATGVPGESVRSLLSRFSPETQAQIRAALAARYEVDPVLASQFAYTASGRQLLTEAGDLVRTASGQNGLYALRAALVLAAADPEGLSILNFLRQFPTDIRIDVGQAIQRAGELSDFLEDTQTQMAFLAEETAAIATTDPPLEFPIDPAQPGAFPVAMQTLQLHDAQRDRTFAVDLYTPDTASLEDRPVSSVIVISNGLGARRDRFDEVALHLASYGFAVAMPDHPGSDRQRLQEFYQGLHVENFDAAEYVNRPRDITFLLDELERLDQQEWGDRLDTNRVGIFGYSFGGTTALALGGARMDVSHLQQDCDTRSAIFNISLLYQCRALDLAADGVDLSASFKDERVRAVFVFVPFGRSLYGPQGLSSVDVPVFWEATNQDILTPLVIEQLPSFNWLTTPNRYLAVADGLPHARLTLDVVNRLTNQAIAWEDIKPITERYHQVLSLTFFQVYVAENETYRPYLSATFAQTFADAAYPLRWVR
ncbi:MAG: alpha/beta hydrolase [Synechococcales bacterium]|nr:alpha/beta hydrolase [Synechococcales bacterium]